MAGGDIDLNAALAQKDLYIREQHEQIIRLKRELDGVASERDLLLCEVSNLRFELEMVELKRLQDERELQLFWSFRHLLELNKSGKNIQKRLWSR